MFEKGKHKLFKPIIIDDKEVAELEYDFEKLPSGSLRKAMSELTQLRHVVQIPQNDITLHAVLFGYAAGLDAQDVMRLHDKDAMAIASVSMGFFNDVSAD